MSHEIIYGKQFIKLSDDKFIPIVLAGSNNCTEMSPRGRERRARSWFNFKVNKGIIVTLKDMIDHAELVRKNLVEYYSNTKEGDDYQDKSFGYYNGISIGGSCRNTTFGMYKGIFITGVRKALTVETLVSNNINVYVSTSRYDNEAITKANLTPLSYYPRTTAELETIIQVSEQKFKGISNVYVTLKGSETAFKYARKKYSDLVV